MTSKSHEPTTFILDAHKPEQLFWHGKWIRLTPTQERILRLLARNTGVVVTYDAIYQAITQGEADIEPQQVPWHISHLKSITASLAGIALPIENFPVRGYCLHIPKTSIILVNYGDTDEAV